MFIHIPKTGGQSISTMLGIPFNHARASECQSGLRFAFVRHPYTRYLSGFKFAQRHGDIPADANPNTWLEEMPRSDETWAPMDWWLNAPVDFIGRFENLAEDVAHVWRLLGRDPPVLLHLNATGPQHINELTAETRRKLADIYAADFARFDYEAF